MQQYGLKQTNKQKLTSKVFYKTHKATEAVRCFNTGKSSTLVMRKNMKTSKMSTKMFLCSVEENVISWRQ